MNRSHGETEIPDQAIQGGAFERSQDLILEPTLRRL